MGSRNGEFSDIQAKISYSKKYSIHPSKLDKHKRLLKDNKNLEFAKSIKLDGQSREIYKKIRSRSFSERKQGEKMKYKKPKNPSYQFISEIEGKSYTVSVGASAKNVSDECKKRLDGFALLLAESIRFP